MSSTQQHDSDTAGLITGLTRPASIEDLPDYQRQGHHVATVADTTLFIRYPELGHTLLAAVEAARAAGLVIDEGRIEVPLTDDEINTRVEQAQRAWDSQRDTYLSALAGLGRPLEDYPQWRRDSLDRFARDEQVPVVEWPAEVSA